MCTPVCGLRSSRQRILAVFVDDRNPVSEATVVNKYSAKSCARLPNTPCLKRVPKARLRDPLFHHTAAVVVTIPLSLFLVTPTAKT